MEHLKKYTFFSINEKKSIKDELLYQASEIIGDNISSIQEITDFIELNIKNKTLVQEIDKLTEIKIFIRENEKTIQEL
jgi:hypothetical protein